MLDFRSMVSKKFWCFVWFLLEWVMYFPMRWECKNYSEQTLNNMNKQCSFFPARRSIECHSCIVNCAFYPKLWFPFVTCVTIKPWKICILWCVQFFTIVHYIKHEYNRKSFVIISNWNDAFRQKMEFTRGKMNKCSSESSWYFYMALELNPKCPTFRKTVTMNRISHARSSS